MDLKNLVLRPNCLLTPSQLVFIPGPRSLFFYAKPFGQLPCFLHEHGYRVQLLNLPFRHKKARRAAFKKWLEQNQPQKFHFVLAEKTYEEVQSMIQKDSIASLTILTNQPDLLRKSDTFVVKNSALSRFLTPLSYRAHQLLCLTSLDKAVPYSQTFSNANRTLHERFLDHCIKLAENELYA